MKTLKISAVATVALTLGWWLRIPHRLWPAHPILADLFIGIVLCTLLQAVWVDTKPGLKS